jgi:hypothetical protein
VLQAGLLGLAACAALRHSHHMPGKGMAAVGVPIQVGLLLLLVVEVSEVACDCVSLSRSHDPTTPGVCHCQEAAFRCSLGYITAALLLGS